MYTGLLHYMSRLLVGTSLRGLKRGRFVFDVTSLQLRMAGQKSVLPVTLLPDDVTLALLMAEGQQLQTTIVSGYLQRYIKTMGVLIIVCSNMSVAVCTRTLHRSRIYG